MSLINLAREAGRNGTLRLVEKKSKSHNFISVPIIWFEQVNKYMFHEDERCKAGKEDMPLFH